MFNDQPFSNAENVSTRKKVAEQQQRRQTETPSTANLRVAFPRIAPPKLGAELGYKSLATLCSMQGDQERGNQAKSDANSKRKAHGKDSRKTGLRDAVRHQNYFDGLPQINRPSHKRGQRSEAGGRREEYLKLPLLQINPSSLVARSPIHTDSGSEQVDRFSEENFAAPRCRPSARIREQSARVRQPTPFSFVFHHKP